MRLDGSLRRRRERRRWGVSPTSLPILPSHSNQYHRPSQTQTNNTIHSATYYFFGGLLLILAALLEWLMGNTFPSVVFAAYGAFFFSFGGTLTPSFSAFASYAASGEDPASGLRSQGFNASFGRLLGCNSGCV